MWWDKRRNKKFKDSNSQLSIFNILIKQRYRIVWSVEIIQREKARGLPKQKQEKLCFYQTFWFAILKYQDFSNSKEHKAC